MARYTVSADTIEELVSSVAHLAGITTEDAGTAAPKGRGRPKKSEAPEPVTPSAAPDNAAPAGFNPTAGAATAAAAAPGPGAFNPAGAAAAAPGPGAFNPAVAAAPGPSETSVKVRAHLEAMAGSHGAANVYNWVNQVLGANGGGVPNATPEHIRDNVLPTLTDEQLADIYAKAGGK